MSVNVPSIILFVLGIPLTFSYVKLLKLNVIKDIEGKYIGYDLQSQIFFLIILNIITYW